MHNVKSDVYSFGVVLWEILSYGQQPYGGLSADEAKKQILAKILLEKPVGKYPEALYTLMKKCWAAQNLRPSFKEIREELATLKKPNLPSRVQVKKEEVEVEYTAK